MPDTEGLCKHTKIVKADQQSIGFTGKRIFLSGLIGFGLQFESHESRICWENLCLSVQAETSSLNCDTSLKILPTVEVLSKIPRD